MLNAAPVGLNVQWIADDTHEYAYCLFSWRCQSSDYLTKRLTSTTWTVIANRIIYNCSLFGVSYQLERKTGSTVRRSTFVPDWRDLKLTRFVPSICSLYDNPKFGNNNWRMERCHSPLFTYDMIWYTDWRAITNYTARFGYSCDRRQSLIIKAHRD